VDDESHDEEKEMYITKVLSSIDLWEGTSEANIHLKNIFSP